MIVNFSRTFEWFASLTLLFVVYLSWYVGTINAMGMLPTLPLALYGCSTSLRAYQHRRSHSQFWATIGWIIVISGMVAPVALVLRWIIAARF